MEAKSQIRQIVEMQIQLNERTVPNWMEQNLDWDSAVLVEVAEAVDSTDWKWWKHTETDMANLRVEAVDLLHFLISKALNQYRDSEFVVKTIADMAAHLKPNDMTPVEWLKQIALYTLENKVVKALQSLLDLFVVLDMDLTAIHQAYITKNLLNHYRQERGYKDPKGQYLKVINGDEDNVVFARLVADVGEEVTDLETLKQLLFERMDQQVAQARKAEK